MKRSFCILMLAIAFAAFSIPSLWAASPSTITLAAADGPSVGQSQGGKPGGGDIQQCVNNDDKDHNGDHHNKPPTSGKTPEPLTVLLLSAGTAGVLALRKRFQR